MVLPAVVLAYVGGEHIVGAIQEVVDGADKVLEEGFPGDLPAP